MYVVLVTKEHSAGLNKPEKIVNHRSYCNKRKRENVFLCRIEQKVLHKVHFRAEISGFIRAKLYYPCPWSTHGAHTSL